MSNYKPDYFVVIKINQEDKKPFYKVFGTWAGSYLGGESWRLNSGVTYVKRVGQVLEFYGPSGSCYEVHKDTYGTLSYTGGILKDMIDKVNLSGYMTAEIMPSDTDWLLVDYST